MATSIVSMVLLVADVRAFLDSPWRDACLRRERLNNIHAAGKLGTRLHRLVCSV